MNIGETATSSEGRRGVTATGRALDLRALLEVLMRRFKLFLMLTALVTVATIGAALIVPPRYTATASLKIDPSQKGSLDIESAAAGRAPDSALVDTEVAVIHSREVAAKVVARLGLVRDPEFNREVKKEDAGRPQAGPTPSVVFEATTDALLKSVFVQREGQTYIVDVAAASSEPEKSARIANAFVDEYLAFSYHAKSRAAQDEARLLNERLGALSSEVQNADERLAQYRGETGIVSGGSTFGTVNDQQITSIASQLASAEGSAAAARSKAEAARKQIASGDLEAVSEVLNSPVITDLRRQRTEVVRDMSEISAQYGPKHPKSIRVNQQLAELDAQISAEARRIAAGLMSDANAAEAQAARLRSNLDSLRRVQASNAQAAVQENTLQANAEAKRTIYNQINQAAQERAQLAQIGTSQARTVSQATAPAKPSFPNKPLFAMLGLVVGAIVGAAGVFAAEALDSGARSVEDVELRLGLPFLGSLPLLSNKQIRVSDAKAPWDYVIHKPISGFAETLRNARSALHLSRRTDTRGEVLLLTSSMPAEGKSVTAVSLSRVIAMGGEKVLLVDCDLRRNTLGGLLPEGAREGLVEVLTGKAMLAQAIRRDAVENLDILPLSGAAFTARDIFGGAAMKTLLADLRSQYDWIILDGPPALVIADTRTLGALADRVVIAVQWAKTSSFAVQTVAQRFQEDGAVVAGVMLTLVPPKARTSLSPRDPAYYYENYGRYYQD